MATVTVSNSASLLQALKSAQPGETISLTPGVYSPFQVASLSFGAPVTITSADPTDPAVLTGMLVSQSSGLNFSNLVLSTATATSQDPFVIGHSSNISLSGLNVHGDLAQMTSGSGTGLLIRESTNVSVTNSIFHKLGIGLGQVNNDGLTISGNSFHDLHIRGIDGGGSNNVTVSYNTIRDIYPTGGLHPDGIQFWTNASNPNGSNINIIGNTLFRGDGALFQGIFMGASAGLPFTNVTIQGNNIAGLNGNAIALGHAIGATVSQNTVRSYTDMLSRIVLLNSSNISLTDNQSSKFIFVGLAGLSQSGNSIIGAISDPNSDTAPLLSNSVTGSNVPALAAAAAFTGAMAGMAVPPAAPILAAKQADLFAAPPLLAAARSSFSTRL